MTLVAVLATRGQAQPQLGEMAAPGGGFFVRPPSGWPKYVFPYGAYGTAIVFSPAPDTTAGRFSGPAVILSYADPVGPAIYHLVNDRQRILHNIEFTIDGVVAHGVVVDNDGVKRIEIVFDHVPSGGHLLRYWIECIPQAGDDQQPNCFNVIRSWRWA